MSRFFGENEWKAPGTAARSVAEKDEEMSDKIQELLAEAHALLSHNGSAAIVWRKKYRDLFPRPPHAATDSRLEYSFTLVDGGMLNIRRETCTDCGAYRDYCEVRGSLQFEGLWHKPNGSLEEPGCGGVHR